MLSSISSEKLNAELRLANATKAVNYKAKCGVFAPGQHNHKYRFYKGLGIMLHQQIFLRLSADGLELRTKLFVGLRPLRESAATSMAMALSEPLDDMVTGLDRRVFLLWV
jgi:hypothetical protein